MTLISIAPSKYYGFVVFSIFIISNINDNKDIYLKVPLGKSICGTKLQKGNGKNTPENSIPFTFRCRIQMKLDRTQDIKFLNVDKIVRDETS